jgi:hypothetical protein
MGEVSEFVDYWEDLAISQYKRRETIGRLPRIPELWSLERYKPEWFIMCGIYVLFKEGVCCYVGQSSHAIIRILSYWLGWAKRGIKRKDFDQVAFIKCPSHQLDEMEKQCIILYRPYLNVVHNKAERERAYEALSTFVANAALTRAEREIRGFVRRV